ncbi:MAG: transposase [Oscillospiraceae bacterium]|nr:transposase [Oscillospiraceae bacterium]
MQKELPVRKSIRLKGYDYSKPGYYFVTMCVEGRHEILGTIAVGQGLCSCRLSDAGNIARTELHGLETRYKNMVIDKYVIMPNHMHAIIKIEQREQSPRPTTVMDMVCAYKSITTKYYNKTLGMSGKTMWQERFHDHIIRDREDYQRIWRYIDENPARWAEDRYFVKGANR